MITFVIGTDAQRRTAYIQSLLQKRESIRYQATDLSNEVLLEHARSANLFGESPVIILESYISEGDTMLSPTELSLLQDSASLFIFVETTFKTTDEKKYKKYATIERLEEKKIIPTQKLNTFALTDAYARRDKVVTWTLYLEALEKGTAPEALSGLLFWKIKTLILAGSKSFTSHELKRSSSMLVSLYHKAHLGEVDFTIGLEQFILTTLSK